LTHRLSALFLIFVNYTRSIVGELTAALRDHPQLIHVLIGPRQVGKTTAAEQVVEQLGMSHHFAAADLPLPPGPEWIETQWRLAEAKSRESAAPVLLVLDEVQKVAGWSEVVKNLWDARRRSKVPVKLLILGSSALLLLQHGLGESLAGRFFLHRCSHWTWAECKAAFGWDLDRWLYYGGYPGGAPFVGNEPLWRRYVADSLIDTVLSRDIFQLQRVAKPALMRNLFGFAVAFPAQIVSFNKMLGQLQEAGNTTTLAHYLELLSTAFLATGLELYSAGQHRKRGSSPKLIIQNNALINAYSGLPAEAIVTDSAWRGRVVENAVGAHLINHLAGPEWSITYWRRGDFEVDYVVQQGRSVFALEVKSGRPGKFAGIDAFRRIYKNAKILLVGSGGIPLEDFFAQPPERWLV